jgi:hypothetical protein
VPEAARVQEQEDENKKGVRLPQTAEVRLPQTAEVRLPSALPAEVRIMQKRAH